MQARDNDVVIRVEHVSKDFVLPHEKVTTIKGLFTSGFRKRTKTKDTQHALKDGSNLGLIRMSPPDRSADRRTQLNPESLPVRQPRPGWRVGRG